MPADVVAALMFLEDYIRYTKLPRKVRTNSLSSVCSAGCAVPSELQRISASEDRG